MFQDLKAPEEPGYDPKVHVLLTDEILNQSNKSLHDEDQPKEEEKKTLLEIVVDTIFRKAQNEKEYCVFYGDLCEKIIRLELKLRGLGLTKKDAKSSMFRRYLLKFCKDSFNQFFTEKTKELFLGKDEEKKLKFKTRLFGNITFVGELFRRKLVLETIILQVFDMLLAIITKGDRLAFINDNTVEGGVVLMEKIGHMIDEKLASLEQQKAEGKK